MLVMTAGCVRDVAASDESRKAASPQGTLSGSVRGPENVATVGGRVVEVVNVETNERQRSTTNAAGGFSFRVKPGKYRVELSLREGESLVRSPGVLDVKHRQIDAHADFIVGAGRVARPRGPAYRTVDGLGYPIG
jgi:Carboxypeptidase regulatory-like domain